MSPTLDAFLSSWPADPWLSASLLVSAAIYGRGWLALHRRDPRRWPGSKLGAFLGGLLALFLAFGSPIESFGTFLLQVHMIQHMLLMMVAPPLLWLGNPLLPILRGWPAPIRLFWIAPVLRSRLVRGFFARITQPTRALAIYLAASWIWHAPAFYEAGLRSPGWHWLQHVCFLGASVLFWYPVIRPYPFRPRWSLWLLPPYLLIADVSNTVLSALLTFSNRVLYPHYNQIPRLWGISAIDDQATAGVIMWVPGSVGFLVPLFAIGIRLMFGRVEPVRAPSRFPVPPILEASRPGTGFDLLKVPILGRFLRWNHARLAIQVVTTALAGVVIADGLLGTPVAPMNLAGVLPWIHWRGFLIVGLLAIGNVSCLACPFLVPRTLARRWLSPRFSWPRRLRSKWLSVALIALFFWSYEAFSLWDSPRATAGIVIGYFVVASLVDGLFRGASFCKYLCPIGQFNFVQSLVSPLEVKVREPAVCRSCRTKECIRGTETGLNGCELELYLPRKAGNLDCTFCLDCIHACPHQNIGILPVIPGHDLGNEAHHSGIGRLQDRPDVAALVLVLVFAGFANAGGMTAPVQAWEESLAHRWGTSGTRAVTTLAYLIALVALPGLTIGLSAVIGGRSGGSSVPWWRSATRYSHALVPIGFGIWLAHYGFHLLTSYQSAVPATQRFVASLGWTGLGTADWVQSCCRPVPAWLPRWEIVCLDVGLLLSLACGYRMARGRTPTDWRGFAPWALLILLLFGAGVWIVLQPMQMRGTLARMVP